MSSPFSLVSRGNASSAPPRAPFSSLHPLIRAAVRASSRMGGGGEVLDGHTRNEEGTGEAVHSLNAAKPKAALSHLAAHLAKNGFTTSEVRANAMRSGGPAYGYTFKATDARGQVHRFHAPTRYQAPNAYERSINKAASGTDTSAAKEAWQMSRAEFLGTPRLTSPTAAAQKQEFPKKIWTSTESAPKEAWHQGLSIQRGEHQFVVHDGDTPVATYSGGDNLVVHPKYRKRGIGSELLYEYKTKRDPKPIAASRSSTVHSMYGKVHERIVREAIANGKPVPDHVLADYPDKGASGARLRKSFRESEPLLPHYLVFLNAS